MNNFKELNVYIFILFYLLYFILFIFYNLPDEVKVRYNIKNTGIINVSFTCFSVMT